MNKVDKIKVKRLMHQIGLNYHMTDDTIKNIVESQWEFASEKMIEMPWDDIHTEEDLDKAKTNFLFNPLGRICVGMTQINRLNRRREDGRDYTHDARRCTRRNIEVPDSTNGEEISDNTEH
jgi:hypothetical protein